MQKECRRSICCTFAKITELNKLSNEIQTEVDKGAMGRSEEINEMYIADRIIEIESLNLTNANSDQTILECK